MNKIEKHIIKENSSVKEALNKLNKLVDKNHLTLFVVDNDRRLKGTITDGDIRRGLLESHTLDSSINNMMNLNFKFIKDNDYQTDTFKKFKRSQLFLIPVIGDDNSLIRIIDLSTKVTFLPIEVVIMAGGKGKRLRPLTENVPKPLLKVDDKPIIEHNIDRLAKYGIQNIHISVNYLGELIQDYFQDGSHKELNISYIEENEPYGTIGSVSMIDKFHKDSIMVMNSDLLTNIDYSDFYDYFISTNADLLIASIPYEVNIPYAVLENKDGIVSSLNEKPTYTYFSNAGIYLIRKELVDLIPKHSKYDATDLVDRLIQDGKKVVSYPLRSYWLDIGKHEDYKRAQEDIKHIKF